MKIPEVILYNTLEGMLYYIRKNAVDNVATEAQSILYKLFNTDDNGNVLKISTFNYYAGAKALFLRDQEKVNSLKINLGYNLEHTNRPAIHILMPQENKGRMDGIGLISGNNIATYDITNGTEVEARSYSHAATYSLIITSNNSAEVTLIYSFLKTCLPMFSDHFELNGLLNMRLSGQDIRMTNDLGPDNIFHRDMSIQFDYENEIPVAIVRDMADGFQQFLCAEIGNDYQDYLNRKK